MQKLIIAIALFLSCSTSFGQGVAPNWTLPDCNVVNHTLYNYLDSQEVVVMEFVMGCSSCTDAGNLLMNVKDYCDINYPGKVNFLLMDYFPSNDCVDVTTTWSSYHFDAYFAGCWAEKDYYYPTLYPMPAIVIAAGNYHTVIYNDLSWQNSDTTLIKQAIDQFFVTVGIDDQNKLQSKIYPNPVGEVLNVDVSAFDQEQIQMNIYDMMGNKVAINDYIIENKKLILKVAPLQSGNYIIELQDSDMAIRRVFIKN